MLVALSPSWAALSSHHELILSQVGTLYDLRCFQDILHNEHLWVGEKSKPGYHGNNHNVSSRPILYVISSYLISSDFRIYLGSYVFLTCLQPLLTPPKPTPIHHTTQPSAFTSVVATAELLTAITPPWSSQSNDFKIYTCCFLS